MMWSELDLIAGFGRFRASATKNDRSARSPAIAPGRRNSRQAPRIGDKYVFTLNGTAPYNGFKAKERFDEGVGIAPWTVHDLRRTAASGMAKLGVSLVVIEKVLNHVSGSLAGIVGVYQRHEFADEKRAALAAWADHVERLVR